MTEPQPFPRVVCHHGQVDADRSIIAINTKDQCISRGSVMVTYGHGRQTTSKSFAVARLLLQSNPAYVTSRDILAAAYGTDETRWPADRTNAVGRPISDLRHRVAPRLGLFVSRTGVCSFRLEVLTTEARHEEVHKLRRVAMGRAKARRSGLRTFGLELDETEAETVRRFAMAENVSFSEAVRTLIQWGFDSAAETGKAA